MLTAPLSPAAVRFRSIKKTNKKKRTNKTSSETSASIFTHKDVMIPVSGVFELALHALQQTLGMHEDRQTRVPMLYRMETKQLDAICFTM